MSKDDFGTDLNAWGRAVHVAAIDNKATDPMIAMTVAAGNSARELEDPSLSYEKDDMAPIRKVLSEPKMLRQLGELSALDLFIGNRDRVLSGNLGNWFYTPDREMTVIDNVDAGMTYYLTKVGTQPPEEDPLRMLAGGALASTATGPIDSVLKMIKASDRFKKQGKKVGTGNGPIVMVPDQEKLKEWTDWVEKNRPTMQTEMLAGLKVGRKRIVKTMTSTKFSNRGKRGAKKAIKVQAGLAAHKDQNHNQVDYYELLKDRARQLDANRFN